MYIFAYSFMLYIFNLQRKVHTVIKVQGTKKCLWGCCNGGKRIYANLGYFPCLHGLEYPPIPVPCCSKSVSCKGAKDLAIMSAKCAQEASQPPCRVNEPTLWDPPPWTHMHTSTIQCHIKQHCHITSHPQYICYRSCVEFCLTYATEPGPNLRWYNSNLDSQSECWYFGHCKPKFICNNSGLIFCIIMRGTNQSFNCFLIYKKIIQKY